MNSLDHYLYLEITQFLNDKDILSFIQVNKILFSLRNFVQFRKTFPINEYIHKCYFYNAIKKVIIQPQYINYIPLNIIHLTFSYNFNQNILGCIPNLHI